MHYKSLTHKAYELKKLHPLILNKKMSVPANHTETKILNVQALVPFVVSQHEIYYGSWTGVADDLKNIFYVNETVQDWFAKRLA